VSGCSKQSDRSSNQKRLRNGSVFLQARKKKERKYKYEEHNRGEKASTTVIKSIGEREAAKSVSSRDRGAPCSAVKGETVIFHVKKRETKEKKKKEKDQT